MPLHNLAAFLFLLGILSKLYADPYVIDVERYKWIVENSPTIQMRLRKYFEKFHNDGLNMFFHADILDASGGKSGNDAYDMLLHTDKGDFHTKVLEGYFTFGVKQFFLFSSGIEMATLEPSEGKFNNKEIGVASYFTYQNVDFLLSFVNKKHPILTTTTSYINSNPKVSNTQMMNIMAKINLFDIGVFFDAQKGLEKSYLEASIEGQYGKLSLQFLDAFHPISYNDYTLTYKKQLFNTRIHIEMNGIYRVLSQKNTLTYNQGFIQNSLKIQQYNCISHVKTTGCIKIEAAYSHNEDFIKRPLDGYKIGFDFFIGTPKKKNFSYFFSWSKNYQEDINRLAIVDQTIFQIGLKLSSY